MHDTHCHLDQIPNPQLYVRQAELAKSRLIAVTNSPEHYIASLPHLKDCHFVKSALGLHPMLASRANVSMVAAFEKCAVNAKFIGEIGLDHSTPKAPQKEEQLWVFNQLLKALGDGNKLVTLHSRGAETVVLNCLRSFNRKPVVFHWFSGSARQLSSVLDDGHYVSLNQAMVRTQKWQELITIVPKDRVLLETDAPHTGNQVIPGQTSDVLKWLGGHWKVPKSSANTQVESNLDRIWPIN